MSTSLDYTINHFIERAKQRYNVTITPIEFKKLNEKVKLPESVILAKNKDGSRVYRIDQFLVVFDPKRDLITTCLPKDTILKKK
jgi:hypothetical protein